MAGSISFDFHTNQSRWFPLSAEDSCKLNFWTHNSHFIKGDTELSFCRIIRAKACLSLPFSRLGSKFEKYNVLFQERGKLGNVAFFSGNGKMFA